MQNLRSLLLSAVAALSVTAATLQPVAAAASSYTVNGNVYRVVDYVSSDANEIRVSTVVKSAAANQTYAARVVSIKQARFLSWFKPNLGSLIKANLWWMGFAAIIESAGWAIDELKGQVVSQTYPLPTDGVINGYISIYSSSYSLYARPNCSSTSFSSCLSSAGYSVSPASNPEITLQPDGSFLVNYPSAVVTNKTNGHSYPGMIVTFVLSNGTQAGFVGDSVSVSDDDLYDAIQSQLAVDPAHAATAFTDPATGKGYADLFDPVPYIPGLSAADEALVNCYISGQLQMVNSQTACYVATQAEYDRVKQQTESLAAGKTPEATADALNSELEQPITQAQYEETNKKYSDAVADVTASLGSQAESDVTEIEDHFNELDGIITELPNTALPAPAHISVPQYVDCQQLHLSDGNGHDLDFPSAQQCAKIETFKQGFGYFLAISVVFLLCMQLLTRPHG